MTDKANIEQEAPASGVLRRILVPVDGIVPVKTLIAVIADESEDISALLGESPSEAVQAVEHMLVALTPGSSPALARSGAGLGAGAASSAPTGRGERDSNTAEVFASPRARRKADELQVEISALSGLGTGPDGRVVEADILAFYEQLSALKKTQKASPLAMRVADAHGVDLASLAGNGSGHGGKVTSGDVHQSLPSVSPLPVGTLLAAPERAGEGSGSDEPLRVIPLTGMRRVIAENVARSASTAPHVTLTLAVDMSEAGRFRRQILPGIEKSHGVRVSYTDIIAKATARALQEHPMLNSTLTDNKITLHRGAHLSIAVSLGDDGLVVPVLRDAQAKSLPEISREIKALAAKARAGKLTPDEMSGGTFSITNLGTYGIEAFNPIINPPQCAILGVTAIIEKPVVLGGAVEIRPMMNLCLSFDHRITDGAPASAFLARLKEILEQPYLMFV